MPWPSWPGGSARSAGSLPAGPVHRPLGKRLRPAPGFRAARHPSMPREQAVGKGAAHDPGPDKEGDAIGFLAAQEPPEKGWRSGVPACSRS